MPTYQYACTDPTCANRFELVQSFTDPNATECPVCAGAVRKVFSAVGVVFKGSGFYRNDSRQAAGKHSSSDSDSSTKSEPSKSTAPDAGDSASNSSKPAEKSSSTSGDGSSSSGSSSNGKSKSSSSGTSPAAASA
jgi:putative FmdB family regulatory protein